MRVSWELTSAQFAYTGETASWSLTVFNDSKVSETVSVDLPVPFTLTGTDYAAGTSVYNGAGSASGDDHVLAEGGSVTIPVTVTVPDVDSYEATAVVLVTVVRGDTLSLGGSTVTLDDEQIWGSAETLRINTHRQTDDPKRNDLMLVQEWLLADTYPLVKSNISDALASGKDYGEYVTSLADPQTAVNTADIATIEGEQTTQDGLIAANTAKVSYDDTEAAAATAAIVTLQGEQSTQDTAIALNTAKTGITAGQANEITANTAKVSYDATEAAAATAAITTLQGEQATQDSAIALNTAKTGITAGQANEITANTAKISYDDTEAAAATAAITTLQGEQATQDTAIALNTAKTGITSGQTSEITANTAKVTNATHTGDVTGSTALTLDSSAVTGQTLVTADALDHVLIADASDTGALKKALVSDFGGAGAMSASTYDPQTIAGDAFARANHTGTQAASSISDFDTEVSNNASVAANTAKVSYDDTEAAAATAAITTLQSEQSTQDTAIALNTAKVSYDDTEAAAATAAITTLQSEQATQDSAIALNTAKTGITSGQASEITANTAKISYTDSAQVSTNTSNIATNVSAIAVNTAKVSYDDTEAAAATAAIVTLQGEQTTQDTAIALNTAKVSYDDTEAAAATAAISTLQSEQTVQDTAIALNTAKVSYTDAALVATHTTDIDALQLGTGLAATTRSGANRTLVLTEANHTVMFSASGLTTVTIPLNSAVAFPTGTSVALHSTGAGGLTLSTSGITINGSSPNTSISQNEIMVIEKTATDTWSVYGGTAA
jgi:hypothetical protein